MLSEFITNRLGDAATDSIAVSTLFFLILIAVLSIKLMTMSAKESIRRANQRFATSDEFRQAKSNFIKRQRTEIGTSFFHSKPKPATDAVPAAVSVHPVKNNFFANKSGQKLRVSSGASMTKSDKKNLQNARVKRGLSPVKNAYSGHLKRNSSRIVASADVRHSAYKKVVFAVGRVPKKSAEPVKSNRPNAGRFSDVPNTYSNARAKKHVNGLLSS